MSWVQPLAPPFHRTEALLMISFIAHGRSFRVAAPILHGTRGDSPGLSVSLKSCRVVRGFPRFVIGKAGAILTVKVTSTFKRDVLKIFPWRRCLNALRARAASILASESTVTSQTEI